MGTIIRASATYLLLVRASLAQADAVADSVNWFGIAAVIGALAWLPILAQWAYRLLSKPSLDVVIASSAELGYTTLGTIFNLQVAARAKRKPALITAVRLRLIHSNGRRIELLWEGLKETLSQAESSSGDTAAYSRTLPAIAVQVLPNSEIAQRTVMFRDIPQSTRINNLGGELVRRLSRNPAATPQEAVATDEFANLMDEYRDRFPWESGDYDGELFVNVAELASPVSVRFRFSISAPNLTHLRGNLGLVRAYVADLTGHMNPKMPQFGWVNPLITRGTPEG